MSDNFKTLGKNTASNFSFFIIQQGLTLVEYAVMIRLLSLADYGLLLFVTAILGQFNFLEGGLGVALEKFIPEYLHHQQLYKISRAIVSTAVFFLIIGCIITLLLLVFVYFDLFAVWFDFTDIAVANQLIILTALVAPIMWTSKSLTGALKGFNRFHLVNKIETFLITIKFLIAVIVAYFTRDVLQVFIYSQVIEIIKVVILYVYSNKVHQIIWKHIGGVYNVFTTLKEIFSYSLWVFIIQLSSMLINQFDKMIVASFLGIEKLPIYEGIIRLMKILTGISSKLNSAVIPIASKILVSSDQNKFNNIGYQGVIFVNAVAAPITVIAIIFAAPILKIFGSSYLIDYQYLFQIGALGYLLSSSRSFFNKMLSASSIVIEYLAYFAILLSLVYLLNIGWVIRFYDIAGAVLISSVMHILLFPIWVIIVKKYANIEVDKFLRAVFKGQWISWMVVGIYFILKSNIDILMNNLMCTIAFMIMTIFILASLSWIFTVDDRIKSYIKNFLKH